MLMAGRVIAGAMMALSLYFIWHVSELSIGWNGMTGGPGGGAFPFWLAAIMSVCAGSILVRSLRGKTNYSSNFFDPEILSWVVSVAIALAITHALMPIAGFYIALPLFTFWYLNIFGKGNIEGVASPETANNAASNGFLLPMLTLGIPGSRTTPLLLDGMVMWGLVPGPMLFIEQPDFVWGLISSLYTANLAAVLVNLALIPVFVWALRMPFTVLCTLVLVLCIVGGYAPGQKMHDIWLINGFGVEEFLLRKADDPMAPLVLTLVLGP